jgi:3-hydroxybutyryl-CoA dehydrogenase
MGHGIAQVAAMAGYSVRLQDEVKAALEGAQTRIAENLAKGVEKGKVTPEQKEKALAGIVFHEDLQKAALGADMAIEAIVEDIHDKQILAELLERYLEPDAIIASNTSSLSIAEIGSMIVHPERVVGMHFFNPVHILPLVEVVTHAAASTDVVEATVEVARRMGKEPIVVKDSPGFASTRLGIALGLEAMRMVEEGVASAEDIDRAMVLGYGHPMGPLRTSDLVGLDVRLKIAESLHAALRQPHFAPPGILQEKVKKGELGKKTGQGFYSWE